MALDFVGFIGSASTLTTQQKIDLLHDFTEQYNYTAITSELPSPPTRAAFANNIIQSFIWNNVNSYRKAVAQAAAIYTELPDPEV